MSHQRGGHFRYSEIFLLGAGDREEACEQVAREGEGGFSVFY